MPILSGQGTDPSFTTGFGEHAEGTKELGVR